MTTPNPDPLLQRLRALPRPAQDEISAARTLARAEAAFAAAPPFRTATRARWPVPAALALWAALYVWGAVRELGRLFPSLNPPAAAAGPRISPAGETVAAANYAGPRRAIPR